ncbi:hypothetical protein [Aeromonas sp. sif2433]|uniref:capsular polysaccharide export protein, LipB/KpsS family n=1 Tax=Aeromonas sp. sif2433 TaxID=2854794 RepID=UPI001C44F390|nr:hypothetical protein [Aeromonas sp. sif2433]MBV7413346.1 hypothetical protein [Aeromonas sp. sif2433]
MKDISILFPDSVHFHERNFKSLFDLIARHAIPHTFIKDRNSWVAAYGDYKNLKDDLIVYYNKLKVLDTNELSEFTVKGINLFDVCRNEALTFFLPKQSFREKISGVPNNKDLISTMYLVNKEVLLLNLSAAWSWLDYWGEKLSQFKNHTYACIFSGAQIYNAALLEILKTHPTTPLVMEHFFTGNEYYIEEKYEAIPNNTNLKHANVYKTVDVEELDFELNRTKIKSINKVILSKNKNVTQPTGDFIIENNGKKVISIIGQVVNDFSIICTAKKYLSSIDFYIELIEQLLTDENNFVVFKAHPWERQKNNVKSAMTLDCIADYVSKLDGDKSARVFLTEDFNLSDLIKQSDHIVTLCSQSAIEAAFLGVKPIQLGQAFYGKKGFTYDFDTIDEFISELNSQNLSKTLSLDEYKSLELFLIKFLEKSLVSVHKSGILSLEKKLKKIPHISLVKAAPLPPKSNNRIVISVPHSSVTKKKIDKLKRNPKKFFIDSRYRIFNFIGKIAFK